jgi:hypothetical protein
MRPNGIPFLEEDFWRRDSARRQVEALVTRIPARLNAGYLT